MTTSNSQFVSKEHYLAFRKAWSNAVNSDKAKTRYEERTRSYCNTREVYKFRIEGWITGAHHVLYNILRNRPFHKGFTMINKPSKIAGGHMPHLGLYQAVGQLKYVLKLIKQGEEHPVYLERRNILGRKKGEEQPPFWGTEYIDKFLAPFDKPNVSHARLIGRRLE